MDVDDDNANAGVRTPEIKLSANQSLKVKADLEISHFSDDELLYGNDMVSGTMEGLVD